MIGEQVLRVKVQFKNETIRMMNGRTDNLHCQANLSGNRMTSQVEPDKHK